MVVRCSNEAPFVVLEPAPSVRTGIRVEVAHGDDPATVIDILPDTWGRQWRDPLKGPGTGSFNIFADNPHLTANPGILDYGNIVRFYLDDTLRFAFLIEKKTVSLAGEGDDAARVVNVSGRGVLAKLEESVVYLAAGLSGDVERSPGAPVGAGAWMRDLLDESQARGEVADVTTTFTDDRDSQGALWEIEIDVTERAGNDLLRVAERHAEVAVDVSMSPTLQLNYYNERGIDRTLQTDFVAPVILRPGHNIVELSADEDGVIRNVLLIETPAGWLERSDPASVSTYGRRVSYLSLGNVTDGGQVDRVADAIFARNAQPAPDLTLEIADVDNHRPYVHFGVGDWVLAPDLDGNLTKHRVRAINVSEDDEGRPRFPIELATVGDELETRMARWLDAMSRGTMGGVAGEVAEPNKTPAEVAQAALTIVETGVDEHLLDDPHPTVLNDLTDVDTATDPPADNEVLTYRTSLGLWVPRPSGGAGAIVPEWAVHLAEPDDSPTWADEFAGSSLDPAWATVVPTGSLDITVKRGLASLKHAGGAANDCIAIVRDLPAFTATLDLEFAWRLATDVNGNYFMAGPLFSRGPLTTDAVVWMMNYNWRHALVDNRDIRSGTFTNVATDHNAPGSVLALTGPLIYTRFRYETANGFRQYHSPDGVRWFDGGSYVANPMGGAPTKLGFGLSTWGSAGNRIVSLEYVRAYADSPAVT